MSENTQNPPAQHFSSRTRTHTHLLWAALNSHWGGDATVDSLPCPFPRKIPQQMTWLLAPEAREAFWGLPSVVCESLASSAAVTCHMVWAIRHTHFVGELTIPFTRLRVGFYSCHGQLPSCSSTCLFCPSVGCQEELLDMRR